MNTRKYHVTVITALRARIEYVTTTHSLRTALNGAWRKYPSANSIEVEVRS